MLAKCMCKKKVYKNLSLKNKQIMMDVDMTRESDGE